MNGNGKIESLLERIALNMERMVERQDAMTERQDAMVERQDAMVERQDLMTKALVDIAVGQEHLRQDMNHGFAQVNARIDNVLAIAGHHHDDHEQRIQLLESHVLGKAGQR